MLRRALPTLALGSFRTCCVAAQPQLMSTGRKRSRSMSPPDPQPEIELNRVESDIVNTVRATLSHYKLETTVRAAGGWVRDKILGFGSDDLDLAVDDMSGAEFADYVNRYLHDVQGEKVHRIGVIQKNPDQSKHLETATFQLHGHWIDVNNLRTETYSGDSRIPEIKIGTAYEDAMRRGLTINSLFYNINTSKVEDFTGQGLVDLRRGIISTPLCPQVTLMDDPLRALRSLRFAGRFCFKIDPKLEEVLRSDVVKEKIAHKISRERIGIEVQKMMFAASSHPIVCYSYLVDLSFYNVVFELPASICESSNELLQKRDLPKESLASVRRAAEFLPEELSAFKLYEQRLLLCAAFLSPFHGAKYQEKKREHPVIHHIILHSLKLSRKLANDICHLLESAATLERIIMDHLHGKDIDADFKDHELVDIGKSMILVGERWPLALHLAMCLHGGDTDKHQSFITFKNWFQHSNIKDIWTWKPLVNGRELMKLLNVKGPLVGELLTRQMDWRILHPDSSQEDCKAYMLSVSK